MTLKKLALTALTLVLPSIGLLAKNTDTAEIRDTRVTIKTGTSETGAAVAPSLPLGKYSTTWPSGFEGARLSEHTAGTRPGSLNNSYR